MFLFLGIVVILSCIISDTFMLHLFVYTLNTDWPLSDKLRICVPCGLLLTVVSSALGWCIAALSGGF